MLNGWQLSTRLRQASSLSSFVVSGGFAAASLAIGLTADGERAEQLLA